MEPERSAGDEADLGVDLLDPGVREAVSDRGEDPVALLDDRAGELHERREGARLAVWKNPENLTGRQAFKLATIQQTNAHLYRAYLLKEQLRQIYQLEPGSPSSGWTAG